MPRLFVVGVPSQLHRIKKIMAEQNMLIPGLTVHSLESRQIFEDRDKIMDDDVVICGMHLYEVCRDLGVRGQIVPIRIQAADFISAISEAKRIGPEANLINYRKNFMPIDIRSAEELFNLKIHEYVYDTKDSFRKLIRKLKEEGQTTVITNGVVLNIVEEFGLHGIKLYKDESIQEAVYNAYNILKARFDEIENNVRQTLFLEKFNDGVISLDEHSRIINMNEKAYSLLNLNPNESLLGSHVKDCIDCEKLADTLMSQTEKKNKIVSYQSKTLLVSSLPIFVNEHFNGTVGIISDADALQQTEYKIRRHKYSHTMTAKYTFDDISGSSDTIRKTKEKAQRYARADSNVLILGETGTGKELFAQSIHNASRRSSEPFIAINCAAVPENLLESEFFGYIEGAFTGARKGGKAGLFEQAHNGTLFLDEIGEIPPSLQAKLLRVLQEKVVMRIGSTNEVPIDVRVISATNVELIQKVKEGSFRKDLFYRIAVLNLFMPPLRERKDDLESIMLSFTKRAFLPYYPLVESVSEKLSRMLSDYYWPGNIRELENTLERMFAGLDAPAQADKTQLFACLDDALEENLLLLGERRDREVSFQEAVKEAELSEIQEVLRRTNGNKKEAAKMMGISRSTLWRKLSETQ